MNFNVGTNNVLLHSLHNTSKSNKNHITCNWKRILIN